MKLLNYQPGELAAKLSGYLEKDSLYKAAFEYTKQRFHEANHLGAHNWEHAYRDTLNAIVIGEAEGADMSIVMPAITMHDIGFLYGATGRTHGAIGADKLREFLQQGEIEYPAEVVQKMADCIRTHKGSMHQEKPESLEAKVVADADLLEKFGPFGVYSGLRTYAEFNYPLETALAREDQVFSLTLETPTAQKLVEPGRQFVANFYKGSYAKHPRPTPRMMVRMKLEYTQIDSHLNDIDDCPYLVAIIMHKCYNKSMINQISNQNLSTTTRSL